MNPDERSRLLEQVLSGQNQVRRVPRNSVTSVARVAAEAASSGFEAFQRNDSTIPLIVPLVSTIGVTWYGCAQHAVQARELQVLLLSWVGPSWTDFNGGQATLDEDQWPEALLKEAFGPYVFRMRLLKVSDAGVVSQRISSLFSALQRKPGISESMLRSKGQLRADLDRALVLGDAPRAEEVLATLRRTGRMTAENLRFVEIRVLAGLGRWEQLYAAGDIRVLCDLRLPQETFADIVEAIYRHYIYEHERAGDLESAISIVKTAAFRVFAGVFRTRRDASRAAVLKAFLLWELAADEPSEEFCVALLDRIDPNAINTRFKAAIDRLIPTLASGRTLAGADRAFDDEKYDEALAAYLSVPPSMQVIAPLIRCARSIDTQDAAQRALEYLARAPSGIQSAASEKYANLLSKLRTTSQRRDLRMDGSWAKWLAAVLEGADRTTAVDAAREGARSWSVDAFAADTRSVNQLVESLSDWAVDDAAFVEQIYPALYEAFVGGDQPVRTPLRNIYTAMLSIVRLRPGVAKSELDLAKDAVAMALACNPATDIYRGIVTELIGLMKTVASFSTLDWAIDICDELSAAACPDTALRQQFVSLVFTTAEKYRQRLTALQVKTLQFLGAELNSSVSELPTVSESTEAKSPLVASGLDSRIALYTLDEQAASRARARLQALLPRATIEVNSDLVCTDRLKHLASTSTVFAFSWKTSTHAAYYCVKDHLGTSTSLCMPKGSGSTSLIRAIYEKLIPNTD
jgi:hypothetical protein